jgi:hypothetical protein
MGHQVHENHDTHRHGPGCGHEAVSHGNHVDYLHDGHRHRVHDGHWDECEMEEGVDELADADAQVGRAQG